MGIMKNTYFLVIPLSIAIIVLLGIVLLHDIGFTLERDTGKTTSATNIVVGQNFAFSSHALDIVQTQLRIVEALAQDETIIAAARSLSGVNSALSIQEIQTLDERWAITSVTDESIRYFLTNGAAERLRQFQKENTNFPELFLTDSHGLNVAMTNKTSDYYQADEAWWTQAYNSGRGLSYVGVEEYDESAGLRSIPLYVPVYDVDKKLVGIIKAVLSIAALQTE